MDLYENTLIGTFLYGLGLEVGARAGERGLVSGVDLLQQTRLDQSLGDLMVRSASTFRLIEFKRAKSRDPKEAKKLRDLQALIYRDPDRETLGRTSLLVHRLVEIEHLRTAANQIRTTLHERAYYGGPSTAATIPELCAATAVALTAPGSNPTTDECSHYLRTLARVCAGVKRPSGGGGTLLVAVRDGIIDHAHVNDLTDIFRTQEQLRQLEAKRELEWQQALDASREQEPVREKPGRSYEPER